MRVSEFRRRESEMARPWSSLELGDLVFGDRTRSVMVAGEE